MRRSTTLTAAGLLGLSLAAAPATTATAAGETCHGQPATHVGTSGGSITGTEGRDVVVTSGASSVETFGGDDLVCITGRSFRRGVEREVRLDTGAGNDEVDGTEADSWAADVELGPGADRFDGSEAGDRVVTGALAADFITMSDTEIDRVSTGAGDDVVRSGQVGEPNPDHIETNRGDDRVAHDGSWTTDSVLDGGIGSDSLPLRLAEGQNTLDNVAGELRHGTTADRRWTSFEEFRLTDPAAGTAAVTIRGGLLPESFHVSGAGTVVANLGGGGDSFSAPRPLTGASVLTGSSGHDRIAIGSVDQPISIDLESGRLGVGVAYSIPAEDFEDAYAAAPRVDLRGTDRANSLYAVSCAVKLVGRNGPDELGQGGDYEFTSFRACSQKTVMKGGRGHDTLRSRAGAIDRMVGGRGNDRFDARGGRDTLFGGPGHDRATLGGRSDTFWGGPGFDRVDGNRGTDTCRAERKQRCER